MLKVVKIYVGKWSLNSKTVNGVNPGEMSYINVNYDHPGECSSQKDCSRWH